MGHVPVKDLVRALISRLSKYAKEGKLPTKYKQEQGIAVLLHKARDGRCQLVFVTHDDHEVRVNFDPRGVKGPGWLDAFEAGVLEKINEARAARSPLILPGNAHGWH